MSTPDDIAIMMDADHESVRNAARKQRAMSFSIAAAIILTLGKIGVAAITGSIAVLSEAAHSLTDLIAAVITLLAIRRASTPPDSRHRYGHEKLENIASAVEGLIILAAISWIIWQSIHRLRFGGTVSMPGAAAAVMLVSGITNWMVARYLSRVGRETSSPAVTADGHHLMTDVYTSLAAGLGLLLVALTGADWLDAFVALAVSALVVRIGARLVLDAVRVLSDEGLPPDEIAMIEDVIATGFDGIAGFHRLRTRRAGSRRHIDLHLTVDGNLPLWRAHEIAHNVEAAIEAALPNADVLTHIEPDSAAPPPGSDLGPGDTR